MNNMVSVVIILKNDLGIVDTINGLNKQNYTGKFEIIVVDRSTIKYPEFESKIPLRWINFDPKGKRYTIPEQRNFGFERSRGEIIVFIDANCIPNIDWLEMMVRPIIDENESVVSGLTLSKGGFTLNDYQYRKLNNVKYLDDAATIALALKKQVFSIVGKFDESFEYGSDTDFTWRAIDAGYKIRFQPNAISYHDWGNTKQEIKRTILYGKGDARLLLKHWRTHWKSFFGKNSVTLLYPTLILCLPITVIFPWYLYVFVLLVVKNIREPNPIGIVIKHLVYGWGVLIEVKNQILNRYVN